jgi:putative ABC transport system permease protein
MNLKFICEGLSKKIIFSLLTIIQFTIVLLCIYVGIGLVNDLNKSVNSVNKYFDDGQYYKIDDKMAASESFSVDETSVKKNISILKDIISYFNNNKNIEFLSVRGDEVLLRKDVAITETIVTYNSVKFENVDYIRTQGFCVNKKFLEKMNYDFLDGSIEEFNIDKNKDYIPVILGYTYKDKYKVGDRIETLNIDDTGENKKSEMKVIGILSEDNYVQEDGILVEKQSLKNAILFPFDEYITQMNNGNAKLELIRNIELKNYLKSGYAILNNNESVDKINKDLLNFELKYQLEDLNKSMEECKSEIIDQLKPGIYMTILVILFSIISVVIVMINSVVKDKKEFGINIMMGATMADIRIRVLGQVFLLLAISIVISSIILKSFAVFKFNIIDLGLTVGVMTCILIVISIIIILTLNKYSINDLIRRSE